MAETIQTQQRFPEPLLSSIDKWAEASHFTRTAAVNYMCGKFLEEIELERLRRENEDLRKKVVALAMVRDSAPGHIQVIDHCLGCALKDNHPAACTTCPWPAIDKRNTPE